MYQYGFEKLDVWQDARKFVFEIYKITKLFPVEEKYTLCSQMQRASVSIVSNIAEGTCRSSSKEKVRFMEVAYGSLMETYCQLYIAYDLQYITEVQFVELKEVINKISNKLNALNRSFKQSMDNKPKND